jgi:pyruvate,water dikinase
MEELRGSVRAETPPIEEVMRRRAGFQRLARWSETNYPEFLRGREALGDRSDDGEDLLRGQPVSPGVGRGPARVLSSPEELEQVRPGDILVTRGADPGWTVVFGKLAGLVMETGGQLSHGAVVAREYGLPAVAGVRGAMRLIGDGQEVVVNGLAGTVRLAPQEAAEESSLFDPPNSG